MSSGERDALVQTAPAHALSVSPSRLAAGVAIVVGVALTWVGTTQFAKSSASAHFHAPAFLLLLSTGAKATLFPAFLLACRLRGAPHNTEASLQREPVPTSVRRVWWVSVRMAFLFWGANYCYLKALWLSPAAVVAAVFAATPVWVFVLSCAPCLLRARVEVAKVVAVGLAVAGTLCFYVEAELGTGVSGVLLTLLASACAALYTVLLKVLLGDASPPTVMLLLSFIGAVSLAVGWAPILLLHVLGLEVIGQVPWLYVSLSALLSLVFNFIVNFGVCYTSPLFVSLGTLLGIPISAAVDHWLRGVEFAALQFAGAALVSTAFVALIVPPTSCFSLKKPVRCSEEGLLRGVEEK